MTLLCRSWCLCSRSRRLNCFEHFSQMKNRLGGGAGPSWTFHLWFFSVNFSRHSNSHSSHFCGVLVCLLFTSDAFRFGFSVGAFGGSGIFLDDSETSLEFLEVFLFSTANSSGTASMNSIKGPLWIKSISVFTLTTQSIFSNVGQAESSISNFT